ncbi:MAG TPA: transposase [Candidatus Binatia bacterium]|nr:transposase [Candidatus Binatia bacterium]
MLHAAIARGSTSSFRIVRFTVQSNHLHFLIEGEGRYEVARGMQGLGIRLAKAVNRALGRKGRVWNDRYHARALRTPREVRHAHALVYVLANRRKHGGRVIGIDACSSGRWFTGWRGVRKTRLDGSPVAPPQTWLLRVGWRRSGSIDIADAPTAQ